jgi:putative flippase GtrA
MKRFFDEKVCLSLRFVGVGILSTLMGYGLFVLFSTFSSSSLMTVSLAYVAHFLVTPFSFLLYRNHVFHSQSNVAKSFAKFQLGYLFPLLLNGPLLYLALEVLDMTASIAQGMLIIFFSVASFFINRYFTFSDRQVTKPLVARLFEVEITQTQAENKVR